MLRNLLGCIAIERLDDMCHMESRFAQVEGRFDLFGDSAIEIGIMRLDIIKLKDGLDSRIMRLECLEIGY